MDVSWNAFVSREASRIFLTSSHRFDSRLVPMSRREIPLHSVLLKATVLSEFSRSIPFFSENETDTTCKSLIASGKCIM